MIVSPTSNSLCVAVYFKRGASKEIIVPVAPDTFDVNVSSADIVPDTVLRTAYLGNANVGADVKLIPCSTIFSDVALPISAPKGITVAPVTFKTENVDSFTSLPPVSNSILLKSDMFKSVASSRPINLTPSIVAVGNDVYPPPLAIILISVMSPVPVAFC